jgi:hypothetical protein
METVDVLMKMPKIDGYAYTGEWRHVVPGESFLSDATMNVRVRDDMCNPQTPRAILRKAEVWKPLTLEKALEMGKARKVCRFRLIRINGHAMTTAGFRSSIELIDPAPATENTIRLSGYGWFRDSDIEYLEE